MNLTIKRILLPIIAGCSVILLAIMLLPKLKIRTFPFVRKIYWQNFLQETKKQNRIDSQAFWQLREFYCPGYFNFDKKGLIIKKQLLPSLPHLTFLNYHCTTLESFDSLIDSNQIEEIKKWLNQPNRQIIFKKNNELIFQEKDKKIIVFVKSIEEMKTANGFFDYQEKDKKLVENKYWLNISYFY